MSDTGKKRTWELATSGFRVVWVDRNYAGEIIDSDVVCDTANNAKTRTPQNAANARLISVALQMYEFLKHLEDDDVPHQEEELNMLLRNGRP